MSKNFGAMVPGADIDFSLDLAGKIPAGATLTGGAVNMRSGASVAQATFTSINGTKIYLRVVALAQGIATFDVVGAFSSGKDDGEQCQITVE